MTVAFVDNSKDSLYSRLRWKHFYYLVFVISALYSYLIFSKLNSRINGIEAPVKSAPTIRTYANPVDSLDGVGYKFGEDIIFEPDPVKRLSNLPNCDLANDKNPMQNNASKIMGEFQSCIKPIFENFKNKPDLMNLEWVISAYECDKLPFWGNLRIKKFRNLHEIKWTILPKCKENNTVLTLGIGHDTKAEESLHRTLPNTKFYGADPMITPNMQLFSAFGAFFPFAVGKKSGIRRFRVLPNQSQENRIYSYQSVTTIKLSYFLHVMLKLQRIDIAWINIEGGELEFLEYFYKGGPLDQKKITICQFNLEFHAAFHPSGKQIFHDFVLRLIEDKRYVFIKPLRTDIGIHRMFFINMEDKKCARKFLQ